MKARALDLLLRARNLKLNLLLVFPGAGFAEPVASNDTEEGWAKKSQSRTREDVTLIKPRIHWSVGFAAAVVCCALLSTVNAQTSTTTDPVSGQTTTTEPSDKYGPGGTHTTVSGKDFKLRSEFYKDKCGKLRELTFYRTENLDREKWDAMQTTYYFDENGNYVVKKETRRDGRVEYSDLRKGAKGLIMDPEEGKALVEKCEKTRSKCSEKVESATGAAETPKEAPKAKPEMPKGGEPGRNTISSLILSGDIMFETVGTGETVGHISDVVIQNLTDKPIQCTIPPTILESGSGKNQDYACPKGQDVALRPHELKTVAMNGVCVNRHNPPVGKGIGGDLVMNDGFKFPPRNMAGGRPLFPKVPLHLKPEDADKLLRLCTAKYDAADKLEKDGALKDMPYKDKKKRKEIIEQWSTWSDPRISEIEGGPPANKDDLKKVVYKQAEEQGPITPEKKKKLDQGIDAIFDKIELTTKNAKDLEKPAENEQAQSPPIGGGAFNVSNDTPTPVPQTQEKPKEKEKEKPKDWAPTEDFVPPSEASSTPVPQTQEKPKEAEKPWWAKPNNDWVPQMPTPVPQTQEKPKWPKPVQDWIDAKNAADAADAKVKTALASLYSRPRTGVKRRRGQAKGIPHRKAKKGAESLREAEKAAEKAHAAEKEAGKNIDQSIKDSVQKTLDEEKRAAAEQPAKDEKK